MKGIPLFLTATVISILCGCSSTPVALAPVGPNPNGLLSTDTTGQLEVYSALQKCRDGNEFDTNPLWYQHTDYVVCDQNGKAIRHVSNSVGHYAQRPRSIRLPPGQYLVKAQAKDYLIAVVPVVIEPGRTTRVHLDAKWRPPAAVSKNEIVSSPDGNPIGWRVDIAKQ